MSPGERRTEEISKESKQNIAGETNSHHQQAKSVTSQDFNNNQRKQSIDQNHSSIIDKLLIESADYLATHKPANFTIEMDPARGRKKTSALPGGAEKAPIAADSDTIESAPVTGSEPSKEPANIPSYSSIFNTNYYRRSSNSPQLKKQTGALDYSEQSTLRMSSVEQSRKQLTDASSYNKLQTQELGSDEDNNEIVDERLPLSSVSKINRSLAPAGKRLSPTESTGSQHYNGNKRLQITNFDHYPITTNTPQQRCEANQQQVHMQHNQQLTATGNKHSPHNHGKISFSGRHNTHQPTSFNGAGGGPDHSHDGHFGSHSRRLDWQESGSCLDCDCNNCYMKFKNAISHDSNCCRRFNDVHGSSKSVSSKTKNLHMVLKSIILVLLTLLLLILFVGIIAASHYMPQVFDRLLTATRSFNVTIAG